MTTQDENIIFDSRLQEKHQHQILHIHRRRVFEKKEEICGKRHQLQTTLHHHQELL